MKNIVVLFVVSFLVACGNKTTEKNSEGVKQTQLVAHQLDSIQLFAGQIDRVESFSSEYIKSRIVDIWLPENYSKAKKYAVLYMHDGQMLFDANTTWNKQEWKIDEVASKLIEEGSVKDFIVVGIWNIRELRNSNYFPEKVYRTLLEKDQKALKAMTDKQKAKSSINSDEYLKFIVKELKPFVDRNYSVKTDRENTFVLGSSRGGLISMYAISEYPEVFGGAACLSTHWIGTYSNEDNEIPAQFFSYMRQSLPDADTHKLYFDYGTETLDKLYLPYQEEVSKILKEKGYLDSNSTNMKFEGADHSENAWNQRLHIPLTFLLGKE